MEFSVKSGNPKKQRSACVVVGIMESRRLSGAAKQIDEAMENGVRPTSEHWLDQIRQRAGEQEVVPGTLLETEGISSLAWGGLCVGRRPGRLIPYEAKSRAGDWNMLTDQVSSPKGLSYF